LTPNFIQPDERHRPGKLENKYLLATDAHGHTQTKPGMGKPI
jgi:hypothetical protein